MDDGTKSNFDFASSNEYNSPDRPNPLQWQSHVTIWTIGHSNHSMEVFLQLLMNVTIERIVDTRSNPYSRYSEHFNKEVLQRFLAKSKIEYLFMGRELGGRPADSQFYDEDGRALYKEYSLTNIFLSGIQKLREVASTGKTAILCSEENPRVCHRKLLIGRYMVENGDSILHIRGDGRVQTETDLETGSDVNNQDPQLALFQSLETLEWKSIRSVLPRKALSNSSKN